MKTDVYTKIVLTIIAICLIVIVLKDVKFFSVVNANNTGLKLESSINYSLVPMNEDGSINVKFNNNDVIDVRLRGIDEASNLRWETIKVEVVN